MSKPYPEWLYDLRPGDVLRTPKGVLRVVRRVNIRRGRGPYRCDKPRRPDQKPVVFVTFAIRRCSWTRRCYTVKQGAELKGWQPAGFRVDLLATELDKEIAHNLVFENRHKQTLTCCDVVEVAL